MPSVLVVDDDPDIRSLVRALIQGAEGLEVVGEAANGQDALEAWADTQPDVIVLDHAMPGMTGIEVAEVILGERPRQTIILFTANATDPALRSALSSGVSALLSKGDVMSLIDTIHRCWREGTDPGQPSVSERRRAQSRHRPPSRRSNRSRLSKRLTE